MCAALTYRNVDERSEFLRNIRQAIRDSVKRMAVPKHKSSSKSSRNRHSMNPDSILNYGDNDSQSTSSSSRASGNKHDHRFSMLVDFDRVNIPDLQASRSRTYGDLIAFNDSQLLGTMSASRNSVSSDVSQSGSARLVHSSQDPIAYSSKTSLDYNDYGTPIWQRRSDSSSDSLGSETGLSSLDKSMRLRGEQLNVATEC